MNEITEETLNTLAELIQVEKIAMIAIGIIGIFLIVKLIKNLSTKLSENLPHKRLLILQVSTITSFFLYTFGIIGIVYPVLAPPKELIFALGGSIAVAVGFALKDIASSVIAGFILLFDRPFQVGDRVTYNDIYGEVISIGMRTVRLNTLDDNLVTIPNAKFLTDAVASGNSGNLHMMITTDFHVDPNCNLIEAQEIIQEIVTTSRFAYLIKPVSTVFKEVEICRQIAVRITVKAYVLDVKYEKAFQTDIVARVLKSFKRHKIPRPSFGAFLDESGAST